MKHRQSRLLALVLTGAMAVISPAATFASAADITLETEEIETETTIDDQEADLSQEVIPENNTAETGLSDSAEQADFSSEEVITDDAGDATPEEAAAQWIKNNCDSEAL